MVGKPRLRYSQHCPFPLDLTRSHPVSYPHTTTRPIRTWMNPDQTLTQIDQTNLDLLKALAQEGVMLDPRIVYVVLSGFVLTIGVLLYMLWQKDRTLTRKDREIQDLNQRLMAVTQQSHTDALSLLERALDTMRDVSDLIDNLARQMGVDVQAINAEIAEVKKEILKDLQSFREWIHTKFSNETPDAQNT